MCRWVDYKRQMVFQELYLQLVSMQWMEAAGLVTGLLCVWLLIRQNIWTWPLGLIYALISVVVFWRARLYADLGLHLFYVAMNIYGWYYWLEGAAKEGWIDTDKDNVADIDDELPVTNVTLRTAVILSMVTVLGIIAMGYFFAHFTNASLPYWDSATTVMSLVAMWMTARKELENWYVWLLVDVIATAIYLYKGLDFYALLYCVYIGMAFAGWWSWRQSMLVPRTA